VARPVKNSLRKSPTGIAGFDEITGGGLPQGRTSLVCGSAGCGKTLFAMEFLIHGVMEHNEPGVFMAFEETAQDLIENVASLGYDLHQLITRKQIYVDHVQIDRGEIEETGEYDLDGLFVRLSYAIDSIGAKRVVLDTLEALFASLPNEGILRAELRRLFRWLKDKGVTAVITAERGAGTLTRHGLEEYVSDCVILLDHRVIEQVSTRRLRIVKYRGSAHGTNEYPFLINDDGITVIPVTSLGLEHKAPTERVSTGIKELDEMLGGKGLFRGASVLVSGTAGTGKTSIAAAFAASVCRRGERCLYFAFEESMSQITRNMRSIGIDLMSGVKQGLLKFHAARPTAYGLEMHVASMHKLIDEFKPDAVVIDPLTNLINVGSQLEVHSALLRLIDLLKLRQVTGLFLSLVHDGQPLESTDIGVSSLMDTWVLLRDIEANGERNRGLCILKSRGMAHSNQVREFRLTNRGVQLTDVYLGPGGLLTGAAREAQEAKERAEAWARAEEMQQREREIERKRAVIEAQINELRASLNAEEAEMRHATQHIKAREEKLDSDRKVMARIRRPDFAGIPLAGNGAGANYEKNPQSRRHKKGKAERKRVRK
jgi:circadian clock protein KaiC